MLKKYDNLIKKMAWGCLKRLPLGYSTLDDLEQEGRIVLLNLMRKRYKPERGKFVTLLYKALRNHFNKIVRRAYAKKRLCVTGLNNYDDYAETLKCKDQMSQLEELERKEIVAKIREVDQDIADLLTIGVSKELFVYARNQARGRSLKNGTRLSKISFAKSVIESFYGVSIKAIIKAVHSTEVPTKQVT